jgi:hypothetical protein
MHRHPSVRRLSANPRRRLKREPPEARRPRAADGHQADQSRALRHRPREGLGYRQQVPGRGYAALAALTTKTWGRDHWSGRVASRYQPPPYGPYRRSLSLDQSFPCESPQRASPQRRPLSVAPCPEPSRCALRRPCGPPRRTRSSQKRWGQLPAGRAPVHGDQPLAQDRLINQGGPPQGAVDAPPRSDPRRADLPGIGHQLAQDPPVVVAQLGPMLELCDERVLHGSFLGCTYPG